VSDLILEIVEGESAGTTFALSQPLEVGRSQELGIVLEDGEVSRRHARISPSDGSVVVEDLGSRNGSFVNEQPIDGPREVRPGDRVRIGLTVFELRSAQQAQRGESGVIAMPQITKLNQDVLAPVQARDLPQPVPEPQPPGLRATPTEPAYVPGGGGDLQPASADEGAQYERVAALRDPRVKHKTGVAAFALLGLAAIAVLVFFGFLI
jgi:pSer/pThr/pTyr-binding forkhead associated (FHA) protein